MKKLSTIQHNTFGTPLYKRMGNGGDIKKKKGDIDWEKKKVKFEKNKERRAALIKETKAALTKWEKDSNNRKSRLSFLDAKNTTMGTIVSDKYKERLTKEYERQDEVTVKDYDFLNAPLKQFTNWMNRDDRVQKTISERLNNVRDVKLDKITPFTGAGAFYSDFDHSVQHTDKSNISKGTSEHEISHASTKGNSGLLSNTKKEIRDRFYNSSKYNKEDKQNNYYSTATEVKARLDVAREILRKNSEKQNTSNPLIQDITDKDIEFLEKQIETESDGDEKALFKYYDKKDIKWMLNNIALKENETNTIQSANMGGKLHKRMQEGGPLNYGSLAMFAASRAEAEKGEDPNVALGATSGALKYGAMGMQTGNPYLAAGAAVYGGLKGFADERAYGQRKEVEELEKKEREATIRDRIDESALKQYPVDGIEGSVSMFNYGGHMKHPFMEGKIHGGELVSLADGVVEVKADNPNRTDSVVIPDAQVKVDDGEIISGDYVTSDTLGFAKKHKKIAKRLGDLEKRMKDSPNNISLANTYRRSKKEEENLQKSQEIIRNKLNLQ